MYRMLIVDDEQIERDGVSFLIQKFAYPFEIFTQNNGRNALEFLRHTPVDVICTDIKMPFMDGLQLCEEARKLYPQISLILLTAYSDFEYARRAIRVRADEYLLKPVDIEEFQKVMGSVLQKLDGRQEESAHRRRLIDSYRSTEDDALRRQVMNRLISQMEQEVRTDSETVLFSKNQLVRSAVEIINREYTNADLTLASLAQRLQVSKGYLSSLFKEETTVSLTQYITLLRMNRAERLLKNTSMKINEVAEAVGYRDASYFGLQFKRLYGVSPAQFRNGGAEP